MTTMPPRFPITAVQIDTVMARFYTKVRQDPTLGPIFNGHIDNWPEHEAKIAGFWRNAILFERGYDGNPMQAHMMAGDVRAEHFDGWLALFDEVLETSLPAETAAAWSDLVHRIGRGLRMGVQDVQKPSGEVPMLG
ncbi:group III truncated hemoglobin [Profundibacter sp.]